MRQYNRVYLSSKTFINSLTSRVEYADAEAVNLLIYRWI